VFGFCFAPANGIAVVPPSIQNQPQILALLYSMPVQRPYEGKIKQSSRRRKIMKHSGERKLLEKKLFATFILTIGLIFCFQNISAQFTIGLPKLPKIKKEKPSPENPGNTTNQERSENKISAGTGNELGIFYFSNQPFGAGTEGSKTSFTSGEFIYGRLVLKGGTVRQVLQPSAVIGKDKNQIRFSIYSKDSDGQMREWDSIACCAVLTESEFDKTYWDFDVFPDPSKAKTLMFRGTDYENRYSLVNSVYSFLKDSQTKEGSYRLVVEIESAGVDFRGNPLPADQQKSITGEISFTFRGSDYEKITANYDALRKNAETASTKSLAASQEVPSEWSETPNRIPPAKENELRAWYLSFLEDKNDVKIIKFYSSRPGPTTWSVSKNDLGLIRYRYSNEYYMVFLKNQAKNECSFDTFSLRQDYSGGGTYGQTLVVHSAQTRKYIDCTKLQ